ncbi:hypothetical protein M3P05_04005 [Sansalvadorimonas sp. 2012CJ34-2]|uniref:BZIP domain-containing protein n=1 Tax=Parendozoicomonas callyspongiae TaxID=2942213 RepID=A0ABT0PCX3_9GAMM|nr:bZIP transcription factor [Sansalvadorimonas sp. 2012CJ34-2]MCL6269106.1 hypothetical protein [Sansalvadorimonas sp. 2012CJ34-2]
MHVLSEGGTQHQPRPQSQVSSVNLASNNVFILPAPAGLTIKKAGTLSMTRAEKRILRNRVAAQNSRDKAKKTKLVLEEQNKALKQQLASLTRETADIRPQIPASMPTQIDTGKQVIAGTVPKAKYDLLMTEYETLKQTFEGLQAQCLVAFYESEQLNKKTAELEAKVVEQEKKIKELEREITEPRAYAPSDRES